MSDAARVPPLVGTAARRRRALAHLSPMFDLHLNRARNPSDVDWSAYDFIALIQLTVDTVALSSGLDGNLGAPSTSVLAEMSRVAAAMAPHRPMAEHAYVAAHILDHLLRHDEPTPYLPVGYADPDTDWQTVTQQVRMLYETLASDGVFACQCGQHSGRVAAHRDEPIARGRTRSGHRGYAGAGR